MQGQFFWYDVMTTDTKAAAKFYHDVIGWDLQEQGPDYAAFTLDGRGVAGLMPVPADGAKIGMRPAWLGYIMVDDVDAMAKRIVAEGGKLHKGPIEVPGIIIFAVVSDPQGAGFLIAKPLPTKAPPPLPAGKQGTFGWHELYALDWTSVFPFYEKLFGWTKGDAHDMGPMGVYQLCKTGGDAPSVGMITKPKEIPVPHWSYYINIEGSMYAALERVTAAGGKPVMGPHQVPTGQWILQAVDPQGAHFALLGPEK